MRKKEITSTGTIDKNGRLAMIMGEINQFFAQHKGSRVFARFTIVPEKTSAALRGYYYNCVVPTFKAAIWESGERLTDEQTERRLRELSPIMYDQTPDAETGKYATRLREINELSAAELIDHIDHLKQLAAENYNCYIEDPYTL